MADILLLSVSVIFSLVVVDDFDLLGTFLGPDEANPELIVDPDRVLTLAVARELFQAIAGRRAQVVQIDRRTQVAKLAASRCLYHKMIQTLQDIESRHDQTSLSNCRILGLA
jgi:hypothetical protein